MELNCEQIRGAGSYFKRSGGQGGVTEKERKVPTLKRDMGV